MQPASGRMPSSAGDAGLDSQMTRINRGRNLDIELAYYSPTFNVSEWGAVVENFLKSLVSGGAEFLSVMFFVTLGASIPCLFVHQLFYSSCIAAEVCSARR